MLILLYKGGMHKKPDFYLPFHQWRLDFVLFAISQTVIRRSSSHLGRSPLFHFEHLPLRTAVLFFLLFYFEMVASEKANSLSICCPVLYRRPADTESVPKQTKTPPPTTEKEGERSGIDSKQLQLQCRKLQRRGHTIGHCFCCC